MNETAQEVRMDAKVREFYDLGKAIKVTEGRRNDLKGDIEEWMGDDDALDVEGLPTLRRKSRSLGKFWDSHALQKLIEERPMEFQKLVELGCVKLDAVAIKQQVEKGQLVSVPAGWVEHQSSPFLVFDR